MSNDSTKIMVIDDDVDIVNVVRDILTAQGYNVVEMTHTRKAKLIHERVASESPQLILLDLMMPDLDGWQVLELLQADPAARNTPIVVFTAVSQALPDIMSYYSSAVSDYILKPFEISDLLDTVERVLAVARASS